MCLDSFHFILQLALQLHWFWWCSRCASSLVGLQVTGVEDWVELVKPALQVQIVGSGSNPLHDLERPYPAGMQLVGSRQPQVLGREEH